MKTFTLEQLEMVDTTAEPVFDNLTSLAASICNAPVSLVSVVQFERNRQYFKSAFGLDVEQSSLTHSFCQYVTSKNEALIVSDSHQEPHLRTNRAVAEWFVRAYLGVPFYDPMGEPIGSICVIDNKPREWTKTELESLRALALCTTDAIRLKYETKRLEELRQEQQEFSLAIAHDVSTPLVTINSVLEHLTDNYAETFDSHSLNLCQVAKKTIGRTRGMINDIASYSQATLPDFDLEDVDINELVNQVLEDSDGAIKNLELTIDINPMPIVRGNVMQLTTLLQNLLSNSLKYRRDGVKPAIAFYCRIDKQAINFQFRDNGIGISSEYKQSAFDLFSKCHVDQAHEGSGIGLALIHRVVTNHGGTVDIDSDGATFTSINISLPYSLLVQAPADKKAA